MVEVCINIASLAYTSLESIMMWIVVDSPYADLHVEQRVRAQGSPANVPQYESRQNHRSKICGSGPQWDSHRTLPLATAPTRALCKDHDICRPPPTSCDKGIFRPLREAAI